MSTIIPQCCIILARISDDREEGQGVEDQIRRLIEYAKLLGWIVGPRKTHVIIENSTSAFHRRKVCRACLQIARHCLCPAAPDGSKPETVLRTWRPGFRRALDMLRTRQADGLIALDLDRACRDPRDLEDMIDVVESRRPLIPVASITGSLRLANDADISMARVMVSIANKSSRDTARRVSGRRQTQAEGGWYGGGSKRPFGYRPDPDAPKYQKNLLVVEEEAAMIRYWADQLLAGVSLRALAAEARERGIPTVKGGEWDTVTIRDTVMKPTVAGLAVHGVQQAAQEYRDAGKDVPYDCGVTGKAQWTAILDEDTWRAVAELLTNPARRTTPGNTPKHLGSLIYRCGVHAAAGTEQTCTVSGGGAGHNRSYMCRGAGTGHVRRVAWGVDRFVEDVLIGRLSRPDAVSLFTRGADVDRDALVRERNMLREQKADLLTLVGNGFTAAEVRTQAKPISDRLDVIDAELSRSAQKSPLDDLPLGTGQVADVWQRLSLGSRRAILRTLMDVTLMPGKGGRSPLSDEYKQHRAGCAECRAASGRRQWQEGCAVGARLHADSYFDTSSILIEWRS